MDKRMHFRTTYTQEDGLYKPSFRTEFRRLAEMFIERYGREDPEGAVAWAMLEKLQEYDNQGRLAEQVGK